MEELLLLLLLLLPKEELELELLPLLLLELLLKVLELSEEKLDESLSELSVLEVKLESSESARVFENCEKQKNCRWIRGMGSRKAGARRNRGLKIRESNILWAAVGIFWFLAIFK